MRKLFLVSFVLLSLISSSQVNLQTGSATFSLPMFNWQDDKSRLVSVVALNYNSGNGLKVNDIASNVGQGWNLIAGGVISRLQVGEPDDQLPNEGNGNLLDAYPPGYLYDPLSPYELFAPKTGCPTALAKYPIYGSQNKLYRQHNTVAADKELDRFAFQFNGRTGLFILKKSNENVGEFLEDTRMKIRFTRDLSHVNQRIRTVISSFEITDENGLIYKFAKLEKTKIFKVSYCDKDRKYLHRQPTLKNNQVYYEASFEDPQIVHDYVINSWYLTEIEDGLTHRKILFNYNVSDTREITMVATGLSFNKRQGPGFPDGYSVINYSTSKTITPFLSSITYPDQHQVIFNYGALRWDVQQDRALESVDIIYQNRFLAKYQLTTSYFIKNRYGTPSSVFQKQWARLCLLSVKKVSVDFRAMEEPYVFEYNLGSSAADDFVPPPFYHLKDVWGYYNGDNNKSYNNVPIDRNEPLLLLSNEELRGLCFLRAGTSTIALNAKANLARNGLLTKIIYPTGATLSYEYAQNTGLLNGQVTNVGGVHVSSTRTTDGGYSNDCNNPLITNYSYTLESSGQSSLWKLETPVNTVSMESIYEPEYKYFYWKPIFDIGCDWKFKYPGIVAREQWMSLTTVQHIMEVFSQVMNIVGGVMQIMDVVSLVLKGTPAAWAAVIVDVISTLLNVVLTCFGNERKAEITNVSYNADINGSNPLPLLFTRVEATESSGQNGKTVFEFTSDVDYPLWEATNPSLSMVQRFGTWAYGLPKRIAVYDNQSRIVKETIHQYQFFKTIFGEPKFDRYGYPCIKCLVTKSSSQRDVDWSNSDFYDVPSAYSTVDVNTADIGLLVKKYDIYAGRAELRETFERIYKSGSTTEFLQTHTRYQYAAFNLVSQIETIQSNGDRNFRNFTYSPTYNTGVFATLNEKNLVSIPVTTTTSVIKNVVPNEGLKYLGETVTEFTTLANGDIRPYRTLEQRLSQPQPYMPFDFYKGPNHPSNPSYKEIQTFTYDVDGNLIGMKDEGNRILTNIYDYNNKYIVASVINADATLDKTAYTSFETGTFGGWEFGGTMNVSNNFITGARSLNLTTANTLTAPLNTNKPYTLSFWSSTGLTVTGNATLIKSAPFINGFTYYEYQIAQGTMNVSIAGTATLDELRLYPRAARMKTVTYDPLIGKTSEADENNRVTYYEYDELARLRFIKDDHRNVVKMYEYNQAVNKQSPAGCIVTYVNKRISEIFTRTNCQPGFIGGDVEYIIPEGRFTSTISQAVVDLQAQDELDTHGQDYANTNGSCIQIFENDAMSQNFTKHCEWGSTGTTVTYTVAAGRYTSTVSKAEANQMAQDEMLANGQAYANENGICQVSTEPLWVLTGNEQCQSGHKFVEATDQNPNSPTYLQTQWKDAGPDPSCPPVQYSLVLQTPCSGIFSVATLNGSAGDVVVLTLTFSGLVQWTGQNPGAGATVSINGGGQSDLKSSPYITTFGSSGFTVVGTITFTMPSNSVTINTQAIKQNSQSISVGSATLQIQSINGTPNSTQLPVCYGYSSGSW